MSCYLELSHRPKLEGAWMAVAGSMRAHACAPTNRCHVEWVRALCTVLVRAGREYTIQVVLRDIVLLSLHLSRWSGSQNKLQHELYLQPAAKCILCYCSVQWSWNCLVWSSHDCSVTDIRGCSAAAHLLDAQGRRRRRDEIPVVLDLPAPCSRFTCHLEFRAGMVFCTEL